jgi:hypothetical protein
MSAAQALKAARDAGVAVVVDGDDLILESSAPPPAAIVELLSRNKAEVLAALRPTADQNKVLTSTPLVVPPPPEPGLEEPCAARRGRVQEINGVLLHFCVECGRLGPFGYGVNLRAGRLGRGYCREHWPNAPTKTSLLRVTGDGDRSELGQAEQVAVKQIQMTVEAMTLEQIQTELRALSGTPFRDEADRLRRRELWRRVDALCARSSSNNKLASGADPIGEASNSVALDR